MKKLIICLLALGTGTFHVNAQGKKTPAKEPVKSMASASQMKTLLDSFSYAAGINVAANMKEQGIANVNSALMAKAIEDEFKNNTKLLTKEQCSEKLQAQMAIFNKKKEEESKNLSAAEKAKGQAFLATNKSKAGIISLPNGLQYEVLKSGESGGIKPTAADTVVVHYTGTLINGTKFDSSTDRGEPATFPVGGVIRGWTEILQMMTKGDQWKVYIPSDLAYGDRGAGASIPPGSTLIFDINLLDVKPAVK